MKGYRTIILNGAGMIVALAAAFGVGLDVEAVDAILLAIFTGANMVLRVYTDSKVGTQ